MSAFSAEWSQFEALAAAEPADTPDRSDRPRLPLLSEPLCDAFEDRLVRLTFARPRDAARLARWVERAAEEDSPLLRGRAAFLSGLAAHALSEPDLLTDAADRAAAHFAQTADPAWAAACDWLRVSHPWLRASFHDALATLEEVRARLDGSSLARLLPECDLSLAYANVLLGRFETAAAQFAACESAWRARSPFHAAHWLLSQIVISILTRSHADNARLLDEAAALLGRDAPPFLWGKFLYRRGFSRYRLAFDLSAAAADFSASADRFRSLEVPVWDAQSRQAMAHVAAELGDLSAARSLLEDARRLFLARQVAGLAANNTHDLSWLAILAGQHREGIQLAKEAIDRYEALRLPALAASSRINLGSAFEEMGDFQTALAIYEQARKTLAAYDYPIFAIEALDRLAQLWTRLGALVEAGKALDAIDDLEDRPRYLARLLRRRAALLSSGGKPDQATAALRRALDLLDPQKDSLELANLHLSLARHELEQDDLEAAGGHLDAAWQLFETFPLEPELAACSHLRARLLEQAGRLDDAAAACAAALRYNQGLNLDLIWEVETLMTWLALRRGDTHSALASFQRSLAAGRPVAARLWQADLADHLLRARGRLFNRVIENLALVAPAAHIFAGMLLGRAQGLLAQLPFLAGSAAPADDAIAALEADLRHLQSRLPEAPHRLAVLRLNQQRRAKALALAERRREVERASYAGPRRLDILDEETVRRRLDASLSGSWLALTYHLTPAGLVRHLLGPRGSSTAFIPLTPEERQLLERLTAATSLDLPFLRDACARLGPRLLPTPDDVPYRQDLNLLIVPHDALFHIPWAALQTPQGEPLVSQAIPCLLPTWQDLFLIWDRPARRPAAGDGLILAISDFEERFRALPGAAAEGRQLARQLGPGIALWLDEDATWIRFSQCDFERWGFLHLATHTIYDAQSGYLSGIVFADGEVWHHRLLQAAPLPPLITLSTCSGIRGFVQAGSAHQGLATSLLAAGAATVIGSLWPLVDDRPASLVGDFYRSWSRKLRPAAALAAAQRQALQGGEDTWMSFLSFGSPL